MVPYFKGREYRRKASPKTIMRSLTILVVPVAIAAFAPTQLSPFRTKRGTTCLYNDDGGQEEEPDDLRMAYSNSEDFESELLSKLTAQPDWSGYMKGFDIMNARTQIIEETKAAYNVLKKDRSWQSRDPQDRKNVLHAETRIRLPSDVRSLYADDDMASTALHILEPEIVIHLPSDSEISSTLVLKGGDPTAVKERIFLAQFVRAILGPIEDIPESGGMSILRNVPSPEIESSLQDVVLRSITLPLWQSVIDKVDDQSHRRYNVAVVGTPGTGKTTITPVLIRMLLKANKKVVYHVRSLDFCVEMTPSENSIGLAVYGLGAEQLTARTVPSLDDGDTYFIVDPGESKASCLFGGISAKFILVASPNPRYWNGSEFGKERGSSRGRGGEMGVFMYHPMWRLDELLKAREYIAPEELSEEALVDRYRQVGGVPRHLFAAAEEFDKVLDEQNRVIEDLSDRDIEKIAEKEVRALTTLSENQPKSLILGFDTAEDFTKPIGVTISPLVEEKVCAKHMSKLWKRVIDMGEAGAWMLEAYLRHLLSRGEQWEFGVRPCVGRSDTRRNESIVVSLGGCSQVRQVEDPIQEAKSQRNVLFHPVSTNNRLFDMAYRDDSGCYHVFQVTGRQTNPANIAHMRDLCGEIYEDSAATVRLYYAIPANRWATFVTNPVNPAPSLTNGENITIFHLLMVNPDNESKNEKDSLTDGESEQ